MSVLVIPIVLYFILQYYDINLKKRIKQLYF
jgi:hypothetical protein